MTAKKCTKKRDARAELLFLPIQPVAFFTFSLSSTSWYLKVPILTVATPFKFNLSSLGVICYANPSLSV